MTEAPNVNPTAKQRFCGYKPFVDAHRELIAKPELQRGFDFALLELQRELTAASVEAPGAVAAHYKLAGAHDLVRIFRMLAEQPVVAKRAPSEREIQMIP